MLQAVDRARPAERAVPSCSVQMAAGEGAEKLHKLHVYAVRAETVQRTRYTRYKTLLVLGLYQDPYLFGTSTACAAGFARTV